LLFRFFLMTGFREQETIYVAWKNVDSSGGVVQVRHKPQYGWTPKAYKEREVPAPAELIAELLKAKPATAKATDLIFTAPEGGPNGHMLRILKRVAKRAGLDPDDCWLHKFRATFATTALQGGVDIRTVGKWLGHSDKDLTSTMRYLRPARGAAVRTMVESIWSTQRA
jgi:integrase/recombinase XerD